MQSKVKYMIDAENVIVPNGTNLSGVGSTLSGSVPLNRGSGRKGHQDQVADGQFVFVAITEAIDTADATETYTLDITVADDAALTVNDAVVGTISVTAQDLRTFILDSENIDAIAEAANTGAKPAFIGVNATLGGDTPDMTYEAFLAPTAHD